MRDEDAWLVPASPEQAVAAVSTVESMTPADMEPDAVGHLARLIVRKDYTEAELAYAVEEMMYDETLTKELTSFRSEATLYPSDFHRFIRKHREMRRRLGRMVDRHEMNRMISEFDDLSRDDFGIAGYTVKDKPLFRYKSDADAPNGEARPRIEANDRPGAKRERPDGDAEDESAPEHVSAFLEEVDA